MVTGQVKMTNNDSRMVTIPAGNFENVENRWRVKG